MRIKLVTWDLLHTLVLPRYPIAVSYQKAFQPYLGLDLQAIKSSFPVALRQLQQEKPLYGGDTTQWWSQVIKRTALGAGAPAESVDASLPQIVDRLMHLFSSKEGYKAREQSIQVLNALHDELGVKIAVVSNADSRMFSVLKDLEFPASLSPIILSEAVGVEKPSREIFELALERVNAGRNEKVLPEECLHVGDELECDYNGARNAGMNALLVKRVDKEDEMVADAETVEDMQAVLRWVRAQA
uniref:Haloacid dehalogenase-like hydrolase domain-containing 3 n=1 Tax=Mycena chlorophos TaxID=658473 RepID=A0ABQ0M1A5_MYCCL|nr:haloacid dehalogenase-like hydrolase domain-containing 3 [Mycena chlorophos]